MAEVKAVTCKELQKLGDNMKKVYDKLDKKTQETVKPSHDQMWIMIKGLFPSYIRVKNC